MWSDPLEDNTAKGLSESDMREWLEVEFVENPYRGCGQVDTSKFGSHVTEQVYDRSTAMRL